MDGILAVLGAVGRRFRSGALARRRVCAVALLAAAVGSAEAAEEAWIEGMYITYDIAQTDCSQATAQKAFKGLKEIMTEHMVNMRDVVKPTKKQQVIISQVLKATDAAKGDLITVIMASSVTDRFYIVFVVLDQGKNYLWWGFEGTYVW